MTPTVKSLVVLDWLDAIGGPQLVEHIHRVYAKELETVTLTSLKTRIWKNIDSHLREIEGNEEEEPVKVFQSTSEAQCRVVQTNRGRGNNFRSSRPPRTFPQGRASQTRTNTSRFSNYRGGNRNSTLFCKLCKASNSPNFKSHSIAECWLLDDSDRMSISSAHAKARALFMTEEANEAESQDEEEEEEYGEEY